jgi:hypothetical protein
MLSDTSRGFENRNEVILKESFACLSARGTAPAGGRRRTQNDIFRTARPESLRGAPRFLNDLTPTLRQ